jgi:hypothetical protein
VASALPRGRGQLVIVHAQHGYAIDWDWAGKLTVWATDPDRALSLVATHRLERRPGDEHEAVVAARRWWQDEGRNAANGERPGAK